MKIYSQRARGKTISSPISPKSTTSASDAATAAAATKTENAALWETRHIQRNKSKTER